TVKVAYDFSCCRRMPVINAFSLSAADLSSCSGSSGFVSDSKSVSIKRKWVWPRVENNFQNFQYILKIRYSTINFTDNCRLAFLSGPASNPLHMDYRCHIRWDRILPERKNVSRLLRSRRSHPPSWDDSVL